jgi:coenzyme F420-reducing hydrogenase alpha subunit
MAATKALDDLCQVEPTPAARKTRELVYNTFTMEDDALRLRHACLARAFAVVREHLRSSQAIGSAVGAVVSYLSHR